MNAPQPAPRSTVLPSGSSVAGHRVAGAQPPVVPDYELIRRIGGGAYGDVWLARSTTGVLRAVKIVWRHTFEDDRPFQREFEGIHCFERLSREHPSQLALFHVGRNEAAGYFYYVMELADAAEPRSEDGRWKIEDSKDSERAHRHPPSSIVDPQTYVPRTLRADLEQGRLRAARVLEIGLALTEALAHLHTHGLVHRDVKPSNVIFVNGRPKLADIGLVTDAGDTRSIVGTEGYLAPEGPGTPQADLFALGKVLYEAATGLDRQQFPQLPRDLRVWPDSKLVFELNEISLRACATDPSQRYANAEAMLADVERLRGGKSVRRAHQVERRWRLLRRGAGGLAVVAVVFALIVLALRVRMPPVNQAIERRSTNEVANGYYKLGRHYFEKNTGNDFKTAAVNFERAIEANPRFAQAYASLALTYSWSTDGWSDNGWNLLPKAKDPALKALELDDSLGDPHIALGWINVMREWNWKAAEQEFKRAIHLNPSSAIGYHFYAEFLRVTGRTSESVKTMTQALRLEPGSVPSNRRYTDHLVAARRYEEAIKQADQAIAMEPKTPTPQHAFRIRALCALGRYPEAIETERKECLLLGESAEQVDAEIGALQKAFGTEGAKGYWRLQLKAGKQAGWSSFFQARAYAQMGETQKAIDFLQMAVEERDVWLTFYVMTDWTLDPLRSQADFHAILQAMGLE